jgi:hypothetical protein
MYRVTASVAELALGVILVEDRLEEEGDVLGGALGADPLDEGMLDLVDGRVVEGVVIEQDLDGVRAGRQQPAGAPRRQEVRQAAGDRGVVAGLLVGQQRAAAGGALGERLQPELGVDQDGAGVAAQHADHGRLELAQVVDRGRAVRAARAGDRLAQRAALVDRRRRDHAPLVGAAVEAGDLPPGHRQAFRRHAGLLPHGPQPVICMTCSTLVAPTAAKG